MPCPCVLMFNRKRSNGHRDLSAVIIPPSINHLENVIRRLLKSSLSSIWISQSPKRPRFALGDKNRATIHFAWDESLLPFPPKTGPYLAVLKHGEFSVLPRTECRQVTPCRASSASGTKAGTTSKFFFETQGFEFLFLSQRARQAAFGGSIAPKTPVLKLNRSVACKPPAAIASESTRAARAPFAKPLVAGLRHRWAK